ncbi:MAG: UDP-N-acetylmuramoyl-L-alanyl-D-glutamate--2,6-diaminopimelate ligase [Betaproteobacteria bacterium]|nr:UDP-N-acetylmuramoyl-L-alanyl-D-glutamate--2,6-diaminopimelate ligase [Betaproteobacteria bacterium]
MMPTGLQPHPMALRDALSDQAAEWLRQRLGRHANLCADSRRLQPGDGFLARSGKRFSVDEHIADAIAAGAAAILMDAGDVAELEERPGQVPILGVPQLSHRMGMVASAFYGRPSVTMQVIAVTGTNGKSTVSAALGYALAECGIPCAVIGTLGVGVFPANCGPSFEPSWESQLTAGLTTPDAVDLQRLLADLRSRQITVVALEASSFGLQQGRLQGCAIKAAAFTNLSHDHLDVHGTMERYAQAKALLFASPSLGTMIVNTDDAYGHLMWRATEHHIERIAIGQHWPENAQGAMRCSDLQLTDEGWQFKVTSMGEAADLAGPVILPVFGRHNVDNALVVAGCMVAMGIDAERIRACLARFHLPCGRLQMIKRSDQPWVCIDYAHSPDALARVLEALRPVAQARSGQLICIFGCGGNRDAEKRPAMGAIAAQLADQVMLTSDNPRNEPAQSIIEAIRSGVPDALSHKIQIQPDRAAAIASMIASATSHDVVLIAGKGHERYQIIGEARLPFSDETCAQQALGAWMGSTSALRAGEIHAAT